LPILFGLHFPFTRGGSWIKIVDKGHVVTDKHIILNVDTLTDESVRRYLAVLADGCVFLDLDKSADFGVIPDFTPVEIDKGKYSNVFSQFDIWGYQAVFHPVSRLNGDLLSLALQRPVGSI
jgi:hypothetical protein